MELKMTEEIREKIIEARKAGKQYEEIATEFGFSRPYVNRICLDAGLKSKKWTRRNLSKADKESRAEEVSRLLLYDTTDPIIKRVGHLIEEMIEASDGGTFYSDGNVGLSISSTEIEIIDIRSGAVASLQLTFKK